MEQKTRKTIIKAVRKIMEHKDIGSVNKLAKLVKADQKTFNNFLNIEKFVGSPRLDTAENIATAVKTPLWQLAAPNMPHGLNLGCRPPEKPSKAAYCIMAAYDTLNIKDQKQITSQMSYLLDKEGKKEAAIILQSLDDEII